MITDTVDPDDVAPADRRPRHDRVALEAARLHLPSSEIYGGINAVWDYGPLGVELKNNVKRAWWRAMVQERDDIVGLDAGILMHPQVWVTSGHVGSFSDPLVECADTTTGGSASTSCRAPRGCPRRSCRIRGSSSGSVCVAQWTGGRCPPHGDST